jgi:hypothetical protein
MCVSSKGLKLRITIATVLTVVGSVENAKLPSSTPDIIRCKDLDDDNSRLHAAGSTEGGQVGGSLFYDPADTVHQRLVALVHSPDYTTTGLKPEDRKIAWDFQFNQYTTPKLWAFTGVATKFDITAAVAAPLKADFTIEVEKSTAWPV